MGQRVGVVARQGFLAEHLGDSLVRAGFEPTVVRSDSATGGGGAHARRMRKRDAGPLYGADHLEQALEGCVCVHVLDTAQSGGFGVAHGHRPDRKRSQVPTLQVLRAAQNLGVKRVVISSSGRSRQGHAGGMITEDSPLHTARSTRDALARRLALEERAARDLAQAAGIELVVILKGDTIGPGDVAPDGLGAALVDRLNGRPTSAFGVEGTFPVVDVRDVALAHAAATAVTQPSPAYLVVAQTISAMQWGNLFSRVTGLPSENHFIRASLAMPVAAAMEAVGQITGARYWLDRDAVRQVREPRQYDCTRVQREFGLSFTPLEASVRASVAWFARNGRIADEARLAIVRAALARFAIDAASPRASSHVAMASAS